MFQRMLDIGQGGSSGGIDVSDTTAIESDVLDGKVFHLADGSSAIGNFIPEKTYVKSAFTVSKGNNLIDGIGFKADIVLLQLAKQCTFWYDRSADATKASEYQARNTVTSTINVTDNESQLGTTNRLLISDTKIGFYESTSTYNGCFLIAIKKGSDNT